MSSHGQRKKSETWDLMTADIISNDNRDYLENNTNTGSPPPEELKICLQKIKHEGFWILPFSTSRFYGQQHLVSLDPCTLRMAM